DVAAMERSLDRHVAAVIIEPMQWGAVACEPGPSFLADVAALCRSAGCLLIVDEVQTALRTWPPLLSARRYVPADVVCLGPSIANGFPIGAAVVSERVDVAATSGIRGGTVAGNPLACAAGAATLRALSDPAMQTRINDSGHLLQSRLRALRISRIKRIVGEGTLASIELHGDEAGVLRAMRRGGLLARLSASGEIRLVPPSVIDRRLVSEIVEGFAAAILESRQHRRRRRSEEPEAVELRGVAAQPRRGARRAS
ncbi:MAG TPA: aminotransferase class III-fold pyridoxal phosphate-dependent enzyme, partial [Candidatus Dormibacteraeota bacterium]|nr:aminotransferase class III-fold pyridoxal phosphate-dependent enzyme [Candidatus Dormibacteraeota bacterium]